MSPAVYEQRVAAARAALEQVADGGWLSPEWIERGAALELATPAEVFSDAQRPLVVALFGGTGVGKSSLLNRMAGQPLARVGVARPTSREATLYLHAETALATLPATLPVDRTVVRRHTDAARRDLVWIDMPDFDSVEQANAELALHWLPHVDLLLYVVSPERYRDDRGWRVLLERRGRQGWIFVLNHWDEGTPEQREDWRRLLRAAGFEDPLLFCTACASADAAESSRTPTTQDDFDALMQAVERLRAAHAVRELDRLGCSVRLRTLEKHLRSAAESIGSPEAWNTLADECRPSWDAAAAALLTGLRWPIAVLAAGTARGGVDSDHVVDRLLAIVRRSDPAPADHAFAGREAPATIAPPPPASLDELWTRGGCPAALAQFSSAAEIAVRRVGLPVGPLLEAIETALRPLREHLRGEWERRVPPAVALPGSPVQRAARRATGFLMTFLPLVALGAIGWQVIAGFYRGTMGTAGFLGSDFAVHSLMLVATTWAIPFTLDRLLKPSRSRSVEAALLAGCRAALATISAALDAALLETAATAGRRRAHLLEVADALARDASAAEPLSPGVRQLVAREDAR